MLLFGNQRKVSLQNSRFSASQLEFIGNLLPPPRPHQGLRGARISIYFKGLLLSAVGLYNNCGPPRYFLGWGNVCVWVAEFFFLSVCRSVCLETQCNTKHWYISTRMWNLIWSPTHSLSRRGVWLNWPRDDQSAPKCNASPLLSALRGVCLLFVGGTIQIQSKGSLYK